MGKTRGKLSSSAGSEACTKRPTRDTSSVSSFSSLDEDVLDLTKQIKLLESPSRETVVAPTICNSKNSEPSQKPRSIFSFMRRHSTTRQSTKNIPHSDMISSLDNARPFTSTQVQTNVPTKQQKPIIASHLELNPKRFPPILKIYGRSNLPKKMPKWKLGAKQSKPIESKTFSKSEPSPIKPATKEEDSNWLLFKSPIIGDKAKLRQKKEPGTKKKFYLKRKMPEANPQEERKRRRKQIIPSTKELDISSSSSSSPIAIPRPRIIRLRTKPSIWSTSWRRANKKKGKSLASILNPSVSDGSCDEGFQE